MIKSLAASNTAAETMTLKEITDLLEVRHDKAFIKVEKMTEEPEFGQVSILDISYEKGNGALGVTQTYQLDKRQSIAVASRLNTALLMRIIDRWHELEESAKKPALPATYLEALEALVASEKEKLALTAEVGNLQIELDQSKQWLTIKRVAQHNGLDWHSLSWRKLKAASLVVEQPSRKIFDANYGEVNTYHADAWSVVYSELDIPKVY